MSVLRIAAVLLMTAWFSVARAGYFYTEDLTNPNWSNWTPSNYSIMSASNSIGLAGQFTMMYNQPVGPGGSEVKVTIRLKDQTQSDYFEALFGAPFGLGAYKILVGVQNPYQAASSYAAAFLTT